MVMSVKEEITSLEEQFVNTKGPGSIAKRKELQDRIDALKKDEADDNITSIARDLPIPAPDVKTAPTSDVPILDIRPMPTKWIKASVQQVQAAEAAGTLCGYDPDKGLALIRD